MPGRDRLIPRWSTGNPGDADTTALASVAIADRHRSFATTVTKTLPMQPEWALDRVARPEGRAELQSEFTALRLQLEGR